MNKKTIIIGALVLLPIMGNAWHRASNEVKEFQKKLDMAIEAKKQDDAIDVVYDARVKLQQIRPKVVAKMEQKYRSVFNTDPISDYVSIRSGSSKHLASEADKLREHISFLQGRITRNEVDAKAKLAQLEEENVKLQGQVSMLELKCLQPEMRVVQQEAQKVAILEKRIRELQDELTKARVGEHQAQSCSLELEQLKLQLLQEKHHGSTKVGILEYRIKELEKQLLEAQQAAQRAQSCDFEIKKLEPRVKAAHEQATKKITILEKRIKELEDQLNESQKNARLYQVCDTELHVAQQALKETVEQLKGMLVPSA